MKIYAPVKDATGVWASVRFINGVGETDNPKLIEWFKAHGYKVPIEESVDNQDQKTKEVTTIVLDDESTLKDVETSNQSDLESMDADELREWAKQNGFGGIIRNTKSKDKLLELLRG